MEILDPKYVEDEERIDLASMGFVFEIPEIEYFRVALPDDEKEMFDELVEMAKRHQFAGSKMAKPLTFHTFVLCGMMELMKEVRRGRSRR